MGVDLRAGDVRVRVVRFRVFIISHSSLRTRRDARRSTLPEIGSIDRQKRGRLVQRAFDRPLSARTLKTGIGPTVLGQFVALPVELPEAPQAGSGHTRHSRLANRSAIRANLSVRDPTAVALTSLPESSEADDLLHDLRHQSLHGREAHGTRDLLDLLPPSRVANVVQKLVPGVRQGHWITV